MSSILIGIGIVLFTVGLLFSFFPCILGQEVCVGTPAGILHDTTTLLVVVGASMLILGLATRRTLLWRHRKEFERVLQEPVLLTELQAFEVRSASGWESFVLYDGGIAQMPTLTGIYMGIWFLGVIVMVFVVAALEHFTGFAAFPETGPTFLGNIVIVLQVLIPGVPVAMLEIRRRRRNGKQTVEAAVEKGQAKLTRWEDVTRIELKPFRAGGSRPGYGRWAITVMTGKKKLNGRRIRILQGEDWVDTEQIAPIEGFLRKKVGEKLWVFERNGLRTERVR